MKMQMSIKPPIYDIYTHVKNIFTHWALKPLGTKPKAQMKPKYTCI